MADEIRIEQPFAENLRRARTRAGLSQEEIASRAALHRTEISQLERGARLPRIDTLLKLSGAMRIEPSELLAGLSWHPAVIHSRGEFRVQRSQGSGS